MRPTIKEGDIYINSNMKIKFAENYRRKNQGLKKIEYTYAIQISTGDTCTEI